MTTDRERDETGQFVARRDSEEVIESMTPGEPHTASELADVVGWPRRSVFDALDSLHEAGRVNKRKVSARTVLWTRPPEGSA